MRWFIYDGQRVLAEIRPAGTIIRRFIDGPLYVDEHILMEETEPANNYYYLLGNLYTVLGVANKNGDLAARYHYDSYGWLARRGGGVSGGGGGGSRLLSIKPEEGTGPVALLVTGNALQPDIACYQGYVQANGTIGEEAVFLTPEEWGTVNVSGEGIIPERTYSVQVDKGTIEEPLLGEAVEFTTWKWGDVANGQGEPIGDGLIDVNDLLCTLEGFDEPIACASANQKPCGQIDDTTNLDDLLVFSAAFAGETYPVSCAAAYPPTCPPSGTITPPKNQPYYFTGQRLDFDERNTTTNEPYLALYHYRARAYDPVHGRFLQHDPLEYRDSANLFEYVESMPTALRDPFGLDWLSEVFIGPAGKNVSFWETMFHRDTLAYFIPGYPSSDPYTASQIDTAIDEGIISPTITAAEFAAFGAAGRARSILLRTPLNGIIFGTGEFTRDYLVDERVQSLGEFSLKTGVGAGTSLVAEGLFVAGGRVFALVKCGNKGAIAELSASESSAIGIPIQPEGPW